MGKKRWSFHFFIRNIETDNLFQYFLVSAVLSIFVIRFYLRVTHYPKIIHGNLHIAHIIFGGFFMLASILIFITFLDRNADKFAAIIGGVGFGTFVDELGKFITRDNNYFYQPTIAIVYSIFILLYLLFRIIDKRSTYTSREYLVNSLEMLKEAIVNDMDVEEKEKTEYYLSKSNPHDPITVALRTVLGKIEVSPPSNTYLRKIVAQLNELYQKIILTPWFAGAVIVFFLAQTMFSLFHDFMIFDELRKLSYDFSMLPFSEWGRLTSSILSGALVFVGIFYFYKSRLKAYIIFKRSVLVSIFLTQFFLFYKDQLGALSGLIFNIILLIALDFVINREKIKEHLYDES